MCVTLLTALAALALLAPGLGEGSMSEPVAHRRPPQLPDALARGQHPGSRFAAGQFTDGQFAAGQFADRRRASGGFAGRRFADGSFAGRRFADALLPDTALPHAGLPDTVALLLLASFTLDSVAISGAREIVAADGRAARRVAVRALADSVDIAGRRRARWEIFPANNGLLRIEFAGRRRAFRGRITIEATGTRLRIVGHAALRDYLASTLAAEAGAGDPIEYLTALAVLQRNYLGYHMRRHDPEAMLCDNTHCQRSDLAGASSRTYEAVDRAASIALTAQDGAPCYYSVNCGGGTLTPAQVWNHAEPGYSNVRCDYCRGSARFRWQRTIAATAEIDRIMRAAPRAPFVDDDFKMRLGRVAGFNNALSNTIDAIERRGDRYILAGRGFGHRVGLCQEGALQLARNGRSAARILSFYFPTATVSLHR